MIPNILAWFGEGRAVTDRELFFLAHAEAARLICRCGSRSIGAVLTDGKRVLLTAYNGPVYNASHTLDEQSIRFLAGDFTSPLNDSEDCPRRKFGFPSGTRTEICPCEHAERNIVYSAARIGLVALQDKHIVLTCGIPCLDCMRGITQVGIGHMLCSNSGVYDRQSQFVLIHSAINCSYYNDKTGLVYGLDKAQSLKNLMSYKE